MEAWRRSNTTSPLRRRRCDRKRCGDNRGGACGQAERKLGPAAAGAGERKVAAVCAREFAGDVQAEAVAFDVFAHARAIEALEEPVAVLLRDFAAGVGDTHGHPVPVAARGDDDNATLPVILDRVLAQILKDDFDAT